MLRLVIFMLAGYLLYRIAKGFLAGKPQQGNEPRRGQETFQDPVCGVYVTESDAIIGRHDGERLFFCSRACLEKYQDQLAHAGVDTTGGHR